MANFKIKAVKPATGEQRTLYYNSATSAIVDESGSPIVPTIAAQPAQPAPATSRETPLGKRSPRVLKVSLGLSCNYECEYCNQRFVPRSDETNPDDVSGFLASLDSWVTTPPERVEFWGGEPFVYIKTMRPLAEALRTKYPDARFSVITNGSLLTPEINDWLDRLGFVVSVSHDGPGQHVRGPDPLADPDRRAAILDLYRRLAPYGRFSFNAMVNRSNQSRAAIARYFIDLTGDENVVIGEGAFVDPYDDGGLSLSIRDEENIEFRRRAFAEIRSGEAKNISAVRDRVMSFVTSLRVGRRSESLGQKCGMDSPDNVAVDLRGNVVTCQNVSASSIAPNGEGHLLGHVSNLELARLRSATHWSHRDECPKCPMLQICRGSCMYLDGPLWEAACNNAYADAVPIFAAGIEFLTGMVPIHIDGPHRADRHDIWGRKPQQCTLPKRRVIPINKVAA